MEPASSKARCPLCLEYFPDALLYHHIRDESNTIRDVTIDVIKSQNPEWVVENGACPKCWEYYQKL